MRIMIKKALVIFIIIATIMVLVFQTVNIIALSNSNTAMKDEVLSGRHQLTTLKGILNHSFLFENVCLTNNKIYDEDEKEVSKKHLFKDTPILLFRFSKINCSDCIIKNINIIKELKKNVNIKYLMISDYDNKRELGIFKRMNGINDQIYNCNILMQGEEQVTYFCIINENGKICNIFFPDDDFPDLTSSYIKIISKKYFSNIHQN